MSKKLIGGIVAILIVILAIVLLYAEESPSVMGNETTLNVSSEGPLKLQDVVRDIRTHDYYRGYDNETVRWMESLGNRYVWFSSDEIVIMDKGDSDKIPSQYVCDAYFQEIFSCNVLEKHPLGNVEYPREVLLVKDVEYIGEETHYYDV